MKSKLNNSFKLIVMMICTIMICMAVLLSVMSVVGCKTQAVKYDSEPVACFTMRYMARENIPSDAISNECSNSIKRDWCVKMLKENPKMFKDFNDCWRTGK